MKQSLKMALLAAAIALTLPAAQASIISFDAMDADIFTGGDVLKEASFNLTVQGENGFSGAIVKNGSCDILDCPKDNASPYFIGLNDGGLKITSQDNQGFQLSSFLSSFIAPVQANIPNSVAKLVVSGHDINNVSFADYFDLPGQNAAGNWAFSQFNFTSPGRIYKDVSFFSCLNAANGECISGNNQAQFALDNINVSTIPAVPEPAEWLLMTLGLATITMVMRRKNKTQNNSAGIAS